LEYQIRGVDDGQKYYFVVQAYNTRGAVSPPSSEISANVVALTALTTDMMSPTPTGKPITWTALAGSGAQLQYQFWRFSQSTGAWTLGQDYGSSNTFTWTPSAEGIYAIQVWARKAGSSETLEAWRSTGLFSVANHPIVVGSLEADVALPASQGTSITWAARATGGPPPLQYQFWRYDQGPAQWVMARDYGTEHVFVDAGSRRSRSALAAGLGPRSRILGQLRCMAKLWRVRSAQCARVDWIHHRKQAVPGRHGRRHHVEDDRRRTGAARIFLLSLLTDDQYMDGAALGPSSSYTWTPASGGNYWLQVWVRRQGSTAVYDAYKSTELFQITNSTPVVRALTSDLAAPLGTETPVTFAVDATGGPGALQYSFWLYSQARDSWSLVRPYGSSNKFTWTPTLGDQGDYVLQALVAGPSTVSSEAWGSSAFAVGNLAPTVQSLKIDPGNAVFVGTPLSVVARASGGPGNLEYRFFRYSMTTQSWTLVQDYSWDNSFAWVPGPLDRGLYTFQVWVRRGGQRGSQAFLSSQTLQVN
jgi:hypothetical protein